MSLSEKMASVVLQTSVYAKWNGMKKAEIFLRLKVTPNSSECHPQHAECGLQRSRSSSSRKKGRDREMCWSR